MRQIVMFVSVVLILSGMVSARASDAVFAAFSVSAWRNAPNQDPLNWSREQLLATLPTLEQMQQRDRDAIIAALGMPGNSDELYTPGMGRRGRLDIYPLSAKNDRVLRIDYDAKDRFKSDAIEASACGCPRCSEVPRNASAKLAMKTLANTVLTGNGDFATATTKGHVEGLLGQAGWSFSAIQQVGGQAWANYGEIWRIAGASERFFMANGGVTARDRGALQDAQLPITDYAIVTVGLNCPSRK